MSSYNPIWLEFYVAEMTDLEPFFYDLRLLVIGLSVYFPVVWAHKHRYLWRSEALTLPTLPVARAVGECVRARVHM